MTWYDSLLFFHVVSAFLLVAAIVMFWSVLLVMRRPSGRVFAPYVTAVTRPAGVLVAVGALGTLVFGVWLAIYVDGYEVWDWWILASLVLWLVGTVTGNRGGVLFARAQEDPTAAAADLRRRGVLLQAVGSAAVLAVLALMIFKPGA